jgi:hypothetical protein
MEKFLLLRPEDFSSIEGCKISVWTRGKMFQHQPWTFFIPRTAIFQRRASF